MVDDDYELLPHKELDALRAEVDRLKRNPLGENAQSQTLMDAVGALNTNLAKLTGLLQGANDEMLKSYHDTSAQEELRKVRAENAKIAHGIVALAGLIQDIEQRLGGVLPRMEEFIAKQERQVAAQAAEPQLQLHADDLSADLNRGPNPFSAEPAPAKPAPGMDVPPPPPAFR